MYGYFGKKRDNSSSVCLCYVCNTCFNLYVMFLIKYVWLIWLSHFLLNLEKSLGGIFIIHNKMQQKKVPVTLYISKFSYIFLVFHNSFGKLENFVVFHYNFTYRICEFRCHRNFNFFKKSAIFIWAQNKQRHLRYFGYFEHKIKFPFRIVLLL